MLLIHNELQAHLEDSFGRCLDRRQRILFLEQWNSRYPHPDLECYDLT